MRRGHLGGLVELSDLWLGLAKPTSPAPSDPLWVPFLGALSPLVLIIVFSSAAGCQFPL